MNYKKINKWQFYKKYNKIQMIIKYLDIILIIYNVKIYYLLLINGNNYPLDMILKYNKFKIMIG